MQSAPSQVTRLLHLWAEGDRHAFDQLVPIVYDRLRELAHQRLRREPGSRSLNTTGLVHEAYLKLVETPRVGFPDRGKFLALASRVMRNLLVDRARARRAAKRDGERAVFELETPHWIPDERIERLDEALKRLAELDPRQSRILEQRYFGGLSLEETAEATGLALATVKRELRSARAWLALEMGAAPPEQAAR